MPHVPTNKQKRKDLKKKMQLMKDTKSKPLHLLPSKRKDIKTAARHSLKDTKKLDMK
jgi:hypothetical protein